MPARHTHRRLPWTPDTAKGNSMLFRRDVIRFYFHKWQSGYTADAHTVAGAMAEVSEFLAGCGITDPGPFDVYVNGVIQAQSQAA